MNSQYDDIATRYSDASPGGIQSRRLLHELIGECSRKRILELGCGTGVDLAYFHANNADVYGVDNSEEMIRESAKQISSNRLFKTTFENTKLESETFDIVYSHYGIYHAKRIHPVFREVSRILKPRGRFVFVVPHPVRQLLEKGDTDYYKNTEYELRFGYEKTVTAVGVAHTMQEYLSEYLLDNFELTAFLEQRDAEAYYMNKDWIYPLYLAVRVQKK